jgi:hypothetical protein
MSMRKILWRRPAQPLDFVPLTTGQGLVVVVCLAVAAGVVALWAGLELWDAVLLTLKATP